VIIEDVELMESYVVGGPLDQWAAEFDDKAE
jgi:hypothetical protein